LDPGIKEFVLSFLRDIGLAPENVRFELLQGDGSKRVFWRATPSGKSPCYIAMANTPEDHFSKRENLSYVMIGKHLHRKGIPVPEIYRYDLERGWFIMEDMGRTSLQDLVSSGENPLPLYERVVEQPFRLQVEGAKGFDPAWSCQTERYDRTVMRRYESDYFRMPFFAIILVLKKNGLNS